MAPSMTQTYAKTPLNTVKRKPDRGHYDLETVHTLINQSLHVDVSFSPATDDPFPVILPMIGVMGNFEYPSSGIGEPLDCYLHGYVSNRFMRTAKSASASDADGDSTGAETGIPVCISCTFVDGVVLTMTSFSHSYFYRSATLFGHASLVTDIDEKEYAMKCLTDKVMPGRWEQIRSPPNKSELDSTGILRVKVVSGSAKIKGQGHTEESADLKDEGLRDRCWTGVVPVQTVMGTPVAATTNRVGSVPGNITECIEERNEMGKEASMSAIKRTFG